MIIAAKHKKWNKYINETFKSTIKITLFIYYFLSTFFFAQSMIIMFLIPMHSGIC